MEKSDYSQLELFTESKGYPKNKAHPGWSFSSYIANYEKIILFIIGFIITGLVSFSLGVEKGKRVTLLKANPHLDTALKIQPAVSQQIARQIPTVTEKAKIPEAVAPVKQEVMQGYTIQLASYKTMTYAQKEAEALRKKGFSPLVLSKGEYKVLCVGSFADREKAKSLLSELKKRYRDCLVRRL